MPPVLAWPRWQIIYDPRSQRSLSHLYSLPSNSEHDLSAWHEVIWNLKVLAAAVQQAGVRWHAARSW